MNILADESVEAPIIARLRQDGHAVTAIAVEAPGSADAEVLKRSVTEQLLLLTADRDFGDIIVRDAHTAPHAGVVLYRLRQTTLAEKADRVSAVFTSDAADFAGAFTVIERERIRRRALG